MPKVFTKRLFNQRGITLIELIAVILIIGIIAAVGVPVVFNQIKGADDAALAANIDVLNGALERYALLENGYPIVTAHDPVVADNDAYILSLIAKLQATGNNGGPYIKEGFTIDATKVTVATETVESVIRAKGVTVKE